MVPALMIKAYYLNEEDSQTIVVSLVDKILSAITDDQKWRYISHYFKELCELAPREVLARLMKEFDEPTGMINLFTEKTDDFMWGTHYYLNILWSLEQLLIQREFAGLAFDVVLKLDNLGIKYKANDPKEIIRTVLCVWGNFSAFDTANAKITAAKRVFELDKNALNIINSVLPDNQQIVTGSFSRPVYRDYVRNSGVSNDDYISVVNAYLSLLIKNALFSPERWSKLLENLDLLGEESNSFFIRPLGGMGNTPGLAPKGPEG